MPRPARKSAFTLVELLISVALLAILLTAIALATNAALTAQRENEKLAGATQTSRVLLTRMRREMRTADAIDHTAPSNHLVIIPPDDGSGLQEIRYEYSPANRTLLLKRKIGGQYTVQTIFGSSSALPLTAFSVQHETDQDGEGLTYAKHTVVQMTFAIDGQVFPVTCSAAPRRNIEY